MLDGHLFRLLGWFDPRQGHLLQSLTLMLIQASIDVLSDLGVVVPQYLLNFGTAEEEVALVLGWLQSGCLPRSDCRDASVVCHV